MIKNLITIMLAIIVSFGAGVFYSNQTAPRPCIANYHTHTAPWFGRMEQEYIENTDPYPVDSDFAKAGYKNPNELMKAVFAMSKDTEWPTEVFVNENTGEEFVVPGLCYVGKVDGFGDPILYWGKKK